MGGLPSSARGRSASGLRVAWRASQRRPLPPATATPLQYEAGQQAPSEQDELMQRRLAQAAADSTEGAWVMDPSSDPPAVLAGVFVYGELFVCLWGGIARGASALCMRSGVGGACQLGGHSRLKLPLLPLLPASPPQPTPWSRRPRRRVWPLGCRRRAAPPPQSCRPRCLRKTCRPRPRRCCLQAVALWCTTAPARRRGSRRRPTLRLSAPRRRRRRLMQ